MRLQDVLRVSSHLRLTSALAAEIGVHKTTLLRWAAVGPVPASIRPAIVGWLASVGNVSRSRALAWTLGGAEVALDALLGRATASSALRAAREASGLTQGEAARRAGVSRATWVAWEGRDAAGGLAEPRLSRALAAVAPPETRLTS